MTQRLAGALLIGIVGTGLLLALGIWQLQRLAWKADVLAEMTARLDGSPQPLPQAPDPARDRFLPVEAAGHILPQALRVITTDAGPAFRVVSPFATDGHTILLDRGVIPSDAAVPPPPAGEVRVTGNLHWPDEADGFTPAPDPAAGLWYARDVAGMAAALGTAPVLLVAREVPGDTVSPRPVDIAGIANNHLEYAITWFSLAATWAGMTAVLLWRIRRRIG